jgi:hypothetical protein
MLQTYNLVEWRLLGCYTVWLLLQPTFGRNLQEPHGVTSQKTPFFIVTAVKTSNLTYILVISKFEDRVWTVFGAAPLQICSPQLAMSLRTRALLSILVLKRQVRVTPSLVGVISLAVCDPWVTVVAVVYVCCKRRPSLLHWFIILFLVLTIRVTSSLYNLQVRSVGARGIRVVKALCYKPGGRDAMR